MKASVIVPCHPRNKQTLPRTLQTLELAARGLDVETIVIEDEREIGPSWARNRGLDKATGDYIFFCDADDEVREGFFSVPIAALTRTGADFCLFSGEGSIVRESREYHTNEEVRSEFLPAFFGYSFDDVRRWNSGGRLDLHKQPGSVWLAAFRRDFLLRHKIRFDEEMTMFEDAAFLSSASAWADRVVTLSDILHDYKPQAGGNMDSGWMSRRHWQYKFASLEFRKRLDGECDGALWKYCEASCVFSAVELLRIGRKSGLSRAEARRAMDTYLADERVIDAVRDFPCSYRHPIVALAVLYLRRRCL